MAKFSEDQVEKYSRAKLLIVEFKYPYTRRQLFRNYKLFVDTDPKSDYEDEIFYNDDLRSRCGYVEDNSTLEIYPKHYAQLYPKEFRTLIENAKSVEIIN